MSDTDMIICGESQITPPPLLMVTKVSMKYGEKGRDGFIPFKIKSRAVMPKEMSIQKRDHLNSQFLTIFFFLIIFFLFQVLFFFSMKRLLSQNLCFISNKLT